MGLERTRALLDAVGAPDQGLDGVLVAGTNGKGSTCAFVTSILGAAGLRVAAMPKPHLVSYTERITIDGTAISEAEFAAAVTAIVPAIEKVTGTHGAPTEFEILTAVALRYARDQGVDLLVCEVGMGGRLDATNVTALGVKVITSIALDHMRYLGDTIPEIATEKAGIIAAGDIVVCGGLPSEALAVVEARCQLVGAELWLAGRDFGAAAASTGWDGLRFDFDAAGKGLHPVPGLSSSMLGDHQVGNAAVAVAAVQAMVARHGLAVGEDAVRRGLAAARWPGRMELFPGSPAVLLDGAHNPAAIAAVVSATAALAPGTTPVMLFGAMADKDLPGMLDLLPPTWPAVFTAVAEERAIPAADLLELARARGRGDDDAEADVARALQRARARAGKDGMVLVLGSLYLAGEVRRQVAAPAASTPL